MIKINIIITFVVLTLGRVVGYRILFLYSFIPENETIRIGHKKRRRQGSAGTTCDSIWLHR